MNHIGLVFQFGWHYLRRYWVRLAAGVAFGLLFGMSNASFVWASKALTERFIPATEVPATTPAAGMNVLKRGKTTLFAKPLKQLGEKADRIIDPWLPRLGVELDGQRLLGLLLFLPLLVFLRSSA